MEYCIIKIDIFYLIIKEILSYSKNYSKTNALIEKTVIHKIITLN